MSTSVSTLSGRRQRTAFASKAWFLVAVLFFAQAIANEALFSLSETGRDAGEGEPVRKNPGLYRALSFGHLPALVDWFWIVSLTDTDIKHVEPGKHSSFFYNVDLMTDLDPLFSEVYTNGANLIAVIQNDGPGARVILDKGEEFRQGELPHLPESYRLKYWSRPWQVPLLLAYVHLFELKNMPDAAVYFKVASELPGVPAYVPRLAARLSQPGGEYEVGLKLIKFMISGTTDPQVMEELERKHANLLVGQFLFELNQDFLQYRKSHAHQRSDVAWSKFRQSNSRAFRDPWGGEISLTPEGKVATSTTHQRVFGLE